jgi:hypothetical protein
MSLKTKLNTPTSYASILFFMALAVLFLFENKMGIITGMGQFPLIMAGGAGIIIVLVYISGAVKKQRDTATE